MMNTGLVTDFYQLTMAQGLWRIGAHDVPCVFDRTYRNNPFGGGYTVVAGLEHLVDFIQNFRYGESEIAYLRSLHTFDEGFLQWLADFRFTGDIYAMTEGTIAFPGEVLLRLEAPKAQALLLETGLTMIMNHESLIATKARRVRSVAGDDFLMEFGLRRAQGESAGHYGARASIVGGFNATSNVEAARRFGLSAVGTMAHSWIMSFPDELTAFREYARQYDNATLLADTYNTLESGVPNAITVFKELQEANRLPEKYGIRLDSGDIAYLSRKAREMLDAAGFTTAGITASNDIDEHTVLSLKQQGAAINSWGIGTKIITADGTSALGGIYKLAGQEENGTLIPKMKFSDQPEKMTDPGRKEVFRISHRDNGKLITDVLTLADEDISPAEDYELITYEYPWRRKKLAANSFDVRRMLEPIMQGGELVYELPSLDAIKAYADAQFKQLWPEYTRLDSPEMLEINRSPKLQQLKEKLIHEQVDSLH